MVLIFVQRSVEYSYSYNEHQTKSEEKKWKKKIRQKNAKRQRVHLYPLSIVLKPSPVYASFGRAREQRVKQNRAQYPSNVNKCARNEMNEWIWIRMHIYYFRFFVYFCILILFSPAYLPRARAHSPLVHTYTVPGLVGLIWKSKHKMNSMRAPLRLSRSASRLYGARAHFSFNSILF